MRSIPNPVGFTLMLGIVITLTNVLTAPPGRHGLVLVGGVVATVLIAGIVAVAVWVRSRLRARGQP